MILFDSRDSGGGGEGALKKGFSSEAKPRVTDHFSSTMPPPLNPESQAVSVSPDKLLFIICFIIPP